jgi:hypothetical protein
VNSFLPGAVPADYDARNRLLNYRRSDEVPKHRVRWNWVADLPIGRGKALGRNVGTGLDKFIGGWQIAGLGSLRSNYFTLPTGNYPTGTPIEFYGYQYPIQDCAAALPRLPVVNGYILVNRINSVDANGKPNAPRGAVGTISPVAPLIPWVARRPSQRSGEYRGFIF